MASVRETVTIEVEAEGDGFRRLASESKNLKKSLSNVDKENRKTSEGFGETAELAEKMRGALGPLGDVLGDATGFLADTTDALGSFNATQVATTAIVLAGVAGFVSFVSAIGETITSIDEMSEALRERGDPGLNAAVASVEGLNAKLQELSVTYDAQWVLLTSKFTPAIGGAVEALEGLIPLYGAGTRAALDYAASNTQLGATLAFIGRLLGQVDEAANQKDQLDRLGQSVTELDGDFYALRDEFGQYAQSDEVEGFFYAVSDATKDLDEALKASKDNAAKTAKAYRELSKEAKKTEAVVAELPSKFLDADLALKSTTETASIGGEAFNTLAEQATTAGEQSKKGLQETAREAQGALDPYLNAVSGVVGSISDVYNQAEDARIAGMKKGSAEQKKALKKQFAANKAFAIVQATIQTAQAVMQALGSMPPPASIVFAALAGAAGAAQIALIAAQKPPSFHRGGIMPDERTAFGGRAITRSNEAEVVITAQGQRTFADTINAMNRGDHNRSGGITVMLDSAPIRNVVYGLGQADPAYGHRVKQ